ncbi:MAG: type II toxin-antitoxin system RelE/ParE family toxin [Phycisphaerae bacterium]|nr:type II toxin-antitoxin system RelE/ParE family toxin [Phycisphaerae bacterium]
MIVSFGDRETERLYNSRSRPRRFPPDLVKVALRKLDLLDAAHDIADLRVPPGNRLEQLKGNLREFWSIRVNDQWRVIFRWASGNALDVRILDYHA